MDLKPFFITTPIYYINSTPHVGHAYTQIAADARARFERLRGREVYFLTGTDENALKVARAAQAQGRDPLGFCDELAQAFQDVWQTLNISYDDFIRTTEERHRQPVIEVVQRLWDGGFLELGTYSGWYSVPDETFFRPEEVVERDGNHYLANPSEDQTKGPLEWTEAVGHFFKLSNFSDQLLKIYADAPERLRPQSRRNETLRFIESGLFDTSISRAQDWGIPLPSGVPESEGKVVYVWFPDALLNYATAPGYLADDERFKRIWPPDLQLMSKDIFTRFHATLWPALLLALGLELPRELFAHGFWTVNGSKIAKRDPETIVEPIEFSTQIAQSAGNAEIRVGVDALRYYSLREVGFGSDGDFSTTGCVTRYNSDLANGLGNLFQRGAVMLHNYFGGRVPATTFSDSSWLDEFKSRQAKVENSYETLDFSGALTEVWEVVAMANRWIEEEKPWAKAKDGDLDAVAVLLNKLLLVCQWVAVCTFPAIPSSAERIWAALGRSEPMNWANALQPFEEGHQTPPPTPIFPRANLKTFEQIENAALQVRAQKIKEQDMQNQTEQNGTPIQTPAAIPEAIAPVDAEAPEPTYISIDDFAKVQLRVGKVIEAERIPKADKLLRLQVDLGYEKRQILAGIAQHYTPEEMLGRSVVIVANLAPRTMRGYESQGMLLAASDDSGKLALVNPGDVSAGAVVR
ncbi:methionine--tRNA ligase [Abditibacteriota bacterium]|nr:methionine--tRNA ligase [Abditibacteriota bacterium]